MEINISELFRTIAPRDYSANVAEIGADAGPSTWRAACEDADELFTGENFNREAFDSYFRSFGAWSDEELAAHSDAECKALMLQFIAGDMRDYCDDVAEWDWDEYESGDYSGRIGRGVEPGTVYYYIGS